MYSNQLSWVIACIVAYIITLICNYLSISGVVTDQKTLADKYMLQISPPGWTFSIWGLIYLWQAAWLIYILYHSIKHNLLLKSQETLTFGKLFYISWIFSCIFNGSWILLFSSELLTISSIVLVFITIALYVNAYSNHKYIGLAATYNPNIINTNTFPPYLLNKTTITLYRILVVNGIAFYATWTSIAQCLNIAIVLTYVADVYSNTSCLIALGLLTAVIAIYWFLDFYYLKKWLIYTYSPYAVLLWALSAISTNKTEGEMGLKGATRNWIYVLIAMVAVASVFKIISGICYKPKMNQELKQSNGNQYSALNGL